MEVVSMKRVMIMIIALMIAVWGVFAVQSAYAAGATNAKATTKAAEKPKTVTINMIIESEKDAEAEIVLAKQKAKKEKKGTSIEKTINLKKGKNYFTYNKGKKGNYTVSLIAYGNTAKQTVTAVKGSYTMFFSVAPPKDGDSKKTKAVEYKDLTKIK